MTGSAVTRSGVVIFTDEEQILDETLLLRDSLRAVRRSPYAWKRVLLALHDLLYCLATSQLVGVADGNDDVAHQHHGGESNGRLLSFEQLLDEWKSPRRMARRLRWTDSEGYDVEHPYNDGSWQDTVPALWMKAEQVAALKQLIVRLRHRFAHFKGYEVLDVRELPDLALRCLGAADSLRYSGDTPYWHKGLLPLLEECRQLLTELHDEYAQIAFVDCKHDTWRGCAQCGAMQCSACKARMQHPAIRELFGPTSECDACSERELGHQAREGTRRR